MSHDDPVRLEQLVSGVTAGCIESDCALLGGETAILPDLYQRGDYDLAGFCVGVVERRRVIDGRSIAPGDLILGVASSGFHSNGYSLVRKDRIRDRRPEGGRLCRGAGPHGGRGGLLTPTRIYVRPVHLTNFGPLRREERDPRHRPHHEAAGCTKTWSGFCRRACGRSSAARSWPVPPVFHVAAKARGGGSGGDGSGVQPGYWLGVVVSPFYFDSVRARQACGVRPGELDDRADCGRRALAWRGVKINHQRHEGTKARRRTKRIILRR